MITMCMTTSMHLIQGWQTSALKRLHRDEVAIVDQASLLMISFPMQNLIVLRFVLSIFKSHIHANNYEVVMCVTLNDLSN